MEKFLPLVESTIVGHPSEERTYVGALINEEALNKMSLECGHLFYPSLVDLTKKKESKAGLKKISISVFSFLVTIFKFDLFLTGFK